MRVTTAGRAGRLLCGAAVAAAASLCALSPVASAADAGSVRFAKAADSAFDVFTKAPTAAQQEWMRSHYWRMRTYAPYFNTRLSWFSGAWVYKDAYAIYPSKDATMIAEHPEWILKDAGGNRLYIQFGCANGTCPQYAADIGNPAFRANWIAQARATMAAGYKGLFVDDVNMYRRVSNGNGVATAPKDPRTGGELTEALWQKYMADFMVEIRNAFPTAEIVHNALWFAGDATPDHLRQLRAADYIELERGVNDAGITGGTGKYALRTFLSYIDRRQAEGHGVVFDSNATTDAARMYGLATYFLVSSGRDSLGTNAGGTPTDWWSGYDVALGAPSGKRYDTGGLIRRDFAGGTTIVNEPGSVTRTLSVGSGYRDLKGNPVSIVTLAPASGIVLLKQAAPTPTPTPTPTPSPSPTPVPTPVPTPSPTPSPTPVPSPVPTPVPTPVATPVPTPVATPVPTPVPAPVPTPTPTETGPGRGPKPPKPPKPRLRVQVSLVATAPAMTTSARARARNVKVSGSVSGGGAGRVQLRLRRGERSVVRRALRLRHGGSFSHVQRLRPGVYRLRVTYRRDGGARELKRFRIR